MIRLLSVVGARPNFIKIAPLIEELKLHPDVEHCLVHSGQHYDDLLSGKFFADLGLPKPDVNLAVGSGTHAVQTAEIMKRIEPVLLDYSPQMVLVVGDVNSTIASALTAVKLGIDVAHIEAGLRSFDKTMPEEINRKLTDAISRLLLVSEQSGVDNLRREGAPDENVFLVGNIMIDSLLRHRKVAEKSPILFKLGRRRDGQVLPYGVLTLHRPSNVDCHEILEGILRAVKTISSELPVFFPVHPRTRKNIETFGLSDYLAGGDGQSAGIIPLDPLGYLDFLSLNDHAKIVFTDSGGVQEETTVLGVPCLTLRDNTERPATVDFGTNQIVGVNSGYIVSAAQATLRRFRQGSPRTHRCPPLWDGKAASRIVAIVRQHLTQADSTRR